jgi:hypothetical protein
MLFTCVQLYVNTFVIVLSRLLSIVQQLQPGFEAVYLPIKHNYETTAMLSYVTNMLQGIRAYTLLSLFNIVYNPRNDIYSQHLNNATFCV